MQHTRDRIREVTDRSRLLLPVEQVVGETNVFLAGWAGYFRYGASHRQFDQITDYALTRLALFVGTDAKGHEATVGSTSPSSHVIGSD